MLRGNYNGLIFEYACCFIINRVVTDEKLSGFLNRKVDSIRWKKRGFGDLAFFFFLKRGYCGYEATLEPILNIRDSMQSFIFRKRCTLTTIVGTYIVRDKRRSSDLLTEASRMSIEPSLSLSLSLSFSLALFLRGNFVYLLIYGTTRSQLEWNENLENFWRETMQSHLTWLHEKKYFRRIRIDASSYSTRQWIYRSEGRSVMLLTQHTLFVTGEQHVNRELEGRPFCVYTRINFHHRAGTATTNRPSVKWNNRLYDKLYFIFYYS